MRLLDEIRSASAIVDKKIPVYTNDNNQSDIKSTIEDYYCFNLSIGSNPDIHLLKPDVITKIHETDLRSIPTKRPVLFERPFFISCLTNEPLWDLTYELGCFRAKDVDGEDRYCLLGFQPKAHLLETHVLWKETWGNNIESIETWKPQIDKFPGLRDWGNEALRFLIVYSILLEAGKTPILVSTGEIIKSKKAKHGKKVKEKELVKYISLTKRKVYRNDNTSNNDKLNKDDKKETIIMVTGFLRHQACGKDWKDHKWVYVECFERRQWISIAGKKYIVDT